MRYYEKAGLIERVGRTTGNQCRFASADLAWLAFLLRLRETGMSLADMQRFAQQRFARLRAAGDQTIPGRITLLHDHAQVLASHISALQQNALALDGKIAHYEQQLNSETKEN